MPQHLGFGKSEGPGTRILGGINPNIGAHYGSVRMHFDRGPSKNPYVLHPVALTWLNLMTFTSGLRFFVD